MNQNKTKPTKITINDYIKTLSEQQQNDALQLIELFKEVSLEQPVMWGSSIIGFGRKIYHYASGRQVDYFLIGFSMRKKGISLYLMEQINQLDLSSLGKMDHGVGCIYVKKLSDIDSNELKKIAKVAVISAKERP